MGSIGTQMKECEFPEHKGNVAASGIEVVEKKNSMK